MRSLTVSLLVLGLVSPVHADPKPPLKPKKAIQSFYKLLFERYQPDFVFSDREPIASGAMVAYIFLAGHRAEFQGRELSLPLVRKNIQRVIAAQGEDGSFAEPVSTDKQRFEATAVSILALRATGNEDYRKMNAKAEKWIRAQRVSPDDPSNAFLRHLVLGNDPERLDPGFQALTEQLAKSGSRFSAWHSALVRIRADQALSKADGSLRALPTWDQILEVSANTLSSFDKHGDILTACAAVRALHYGYVVSRSSK